MPLSFLFVLLASLLMALANFLIRQTIDMSQFRKDHLLPLRLGSTALISMLFVINPQMLALNPYVIIIGCITGILQGFMMHFAVRSMTLGPSSLVLAIQNASCIVPSILLWMMFGEDYGHDYSLWNLIGACIVSVGLFFAFSPSFSSHNRSRFFTNLACLVFFQVLFLTAFQWFALLQRQDLPAHRLLFSRFSAQEANLFLPLCFLTSFLMNLTKQKIQFVDPTLSRKQHIILGVGGGIAAGVGGKLLEISTRLASTSLENSMLFPLLAVTQGIFNCAWGRYFFSEKVFWPALTMALIGLFVALYV